MWGIRVRGWRVGDNEGLSVGDKGVRVESGG